MSEPITAALISGGKGIFDATKPQQSVFLNYIFLHWLGGKKMLIANETVRAEAENAYEIKKLEGTITRDRIINAIKSEDDEVEGHNMLGVLEKTLPKLNPGDRKGEIDSDKVKRLKDLSKEFSSDDMQEIVAGILAGEYNNPGTYSLKTMSVIKNLSRNEINLFRKFGGLIVDGDFLFGDFFQLGSETHKKLQSNGIQYLDYLYLQELGLIVGSNSSRKMGGPIQTEYTYHFQIAKTNVIFEKKGESTLTGMSNLTKAGKDLFALIEPIFNEELFLLTKQELIKQGFTEVIY